MIDRHFDGFYQDELATWHNEQFGTKSCLNRSSAVLTRDILRNLKGHYSTAPCEVQVRMKKLLSNFKRTDFSLNEIFDVFKFGKHSYNLFNEWLPCDLIHVWHFADPDLVYKVEANQSWVRLSHKGTALKQFTRKGYEGRKTAMLVKPWYTNCCETLVPPSVAILSLYVLASQAEVHLTGDISKLDVTGGVINKLPVRISNVRDDHLSLLSLANLVYAGAFCDEDALVRLDKHFVPYEYSFKYGKVTYKKSKNWMSLMMALKSSLSK